MLIILQAGVDKDALDNYREKFVSQISEMVTLVRSDLKPLVHSLNILFDLIYLHRNVQLWFHCLLLMCMLEMSWTRCVQRVVHM